VFAADRQLRPPTRRLVASGVGFDVKTKVADFEWKSVDYVCEGSTKAIATREHIGRAILRSRAAGQEATGLEADTTVFQARIVGGAQYWYDKGEPSGSR